jgi:hypothetical protein
MKQGWNSTSPSRDLVARRPGVVELNRIDAALDLDRIRLPEDGKESGPVKIVAPQ